MSSNQVLCNGTTACHTASVSGSAVRLVPIILDNYGANNSHYTTELTLANLTASPLQLTLVYKAALGSGSGLVPLTLAAGQQQIVPNAISFLREQGLPIPGDATSAGGALYVVPPSSTNSGSFVVGARTSTPAPSGGTFGLYYPGLSLDQSSTSTATIAGLQQNSSQRSNLAVVNWGEASDSITLQITYYDASGTEVGSPTVVKLAPGQWYQDGTPLSSRGATSGYALIQETSGSSSYIAYGVLNDQVTNDGSYIPMSF